MAASFTAALDVDPGPGEAIRRSEGFTDLLALAFDSSGSFRWAWSGGGPLVERAQAVAVGRDGGVWFIGFFVDGFTVETAPEPTELRSMGRSDALLIRLDGDGRPRVAMSFGGASADYGYGAAASVEGGVLVTGRFGSEIDIDPSRLGEEIVSRGRSDVFAVSVDTSGGVSWVRSFGGAGLDRGLAIVAAGEGTVVLCGAFGATLELSSAPSLTEPSPQSAGAADAFVIRFQP